MYSFNDTRCDKHTHTHVRIPATAGHMEKREIEKNRKLEMGTKNAPINVFFIVCLVIVASLSGPHTSVTALRKCVYLCLLGPSTYRKFQMKHIQIFHIHANCRTLQLSLSRENEREGLLPDCRFDMKESESEDYLI